MIRAATGSYSHMCGWVVSATGAICRMGHTVLDDRSPQDMIEDFVASQSQIAPWVGPADDLREVVESHPIGPVSDYYMLPEFMQARSPSRALLLLDT
jgi:hypothetical protein